MGALFMALGRAALAEQHMRDFNSLALANTAWAFATVGHKEERLFTALAVVSPFSVAWVTFPPPSPARGRLQPLLDIFSNQFLR